VRKTEREMRKNSSRLFTKWLLVDYVNFDKKFKRGGASENRVSVSDVHTEKKFEGRFL